MLQMEFVCHPLCSLRADLRFHFFSDVPLFLHSGWTNVLLGMHIDMVMVCSCQEVLFKVPKNMCPDWSVDRTTSQCILQSGGGVTIVYSALGSLTAICFSDYHLCIQYCLYHQHFNLHGFASKR